MKVKMEVKDLEIAIGKMRKYAEEKTIGVKDIIKSTAEDIEEIQKSKVRKLSGDTADSIKIEYLEEGLTATIAPRLPKGFKMNWIEFGTKNQPATPFMVPSADMTRPGYVSAMIAELRKV